MDEMKEIPKLTEEEKQELDKQIKELEEKIHPIHQELEKLLDQLAELNDRRHPERREEVIKETLYRTFLKSPKSLEQVVSYMLWKGPDDEDELWDNWHLV